MKTHGRMELQCPIFLTYELDKNKWPYLHSGCFTTRMEPLFLVVLRAEWAQGGFGEEKITVFWGRGV
jgi:hypothetical protein